MASTTEPISKEQHKEQKITSRQSVYNEHLYFRALTEISPAGADGASSGLLPEKLSQAQFLNIVNVTHASSAPLHLVFCDLSGVNLVGANFTKADLRTSILKGSRMPKFCFDKANLSGADFSGCYLVESSFKEASLFKCKLSGAKLTRASLNEASLVQADLSGADLTSADVSQAKFAGDLPSLSSLTFFFLILSILTGANLSNIVGFTQDQFRSARTWKTVNENEERRIAYAGCTFLNFDFTGWNLQNVTFSTARLSGCRLMGADVRGERRADCSLKERLKREDERIVRQSLPHKRENREASRHREKGTQSADSSLGSNFSYAQIDTKEFGFVKNLNFEGCDLTGLTLAHLRLNGANFRNANLTLTNFHHSELARVMMENAKLFQTNFFGTILDPANLMQVRKREDGRRCFVGCNLTAQRFTGLDLARCDFTGAILHAALLDRATLTDVVL